MNTAFVFYTLWKNQYTIIYAGRTIHVDHLATVAVYCKYKRIGVRMLYY